MVTLLTPRRTVVTLLILLLVTLTIPRLVADRGIMKRRVSEPIPDFSDVVLLLVYSDQTTYSVTKQSDIQDFRQVVFSQRPRPAGGESSAYWQLEEQFGTDVRVEAYDKQENLRVIVSCRSKEVASRAPAISRAFGDPGSVAALYPESPNTEFRFFPLGSAWEAWITRVKKHYPGTRVEMGN